MQSLNNLAYNSSKWAYRGRNELLNFLKPKVSFEIAYKIAENTENGCLIGKGSNNRFSSTIQTLDGKNLLVEPKHHYIHVTPVKTGLIDQGWKRNLLECIKRIVSVWILFARPVKIVAPILYQIPSTIVSDIKEGKTKNYLSASQEATVEFRVKFEESDWKEKLEAIENKSKNLKPGHGERMYTFPNDVPKGVIHVDLIPLTEKAIVLDVNERGEKLQEASQYRSLQETFGATTSFNNPESKIEKTQNGWKILYNRPINFIAHSLLIDEGMIIYSGLCNPNGKVRNLLTLSDPQRKIDFNSVQLQVQKSDTSTTINIIAQS